MGHVIGTGPQLADLIEEEETGGHGGEQFVADDRGHVLALLDLPLLLDFLQVVEAGVNFLGFVTQVDRDGTLAEVVLAPHADRHNAAVQV